MLPEGLGSISGGEGGIKGGDAKSGITKSGSGNVQNAGIVFAPRNNIPTAQSLGVSRSSANMSPSLVVVGGLAVAGIAAFLIYKKVM